MNKLFIALPIISLLLIGIFLNKNTQESALTSSSVTLKEWNNCTEEKFKIKHDCQTSQGYLSTSSQFSYLTYYLSKNSTSECKQYGSYIYHSTYEAPINFNNYFENCFLSLEAQQIAQQNLCFETTYYIPKYIECAGY